MRFGNLRGRLVVLDEERAVDVEQYSGGRFASDPMQMFEQWAALLEWAGSVDLDGGEAYDAKDLGAPLPRPRQVFAVALNYRPHAAEAGFTAPEVPLIFTKYPSSVTGPYDVVDLPEGNVDWELELVTVFARDAYQVPAAEAWDAVAGVTVGQDLSERVLQLRGKPPQFSLAKSHPGFAPIGPALVTTDELPDPDDLQLTCDLSGQQVQQARTSEMVFSVPQLVEHITRVCQVYAGDLIFTGTPSGVGNRMSPQRFLGPDDELVSTIEGVGQMRNRFRHASPRP